MRFHLTSAVILLAIVALVGVALGGCEGSKDDKSLGIPKADMKAFIATSNDLRTYSDASAEFMAADADATQMRTALDTMDGALTSAQDKALDVEDSDFRSVLQDYVGKYQHVVMVADRILGYDEDTTIAADTGVENDLVEEFERVVLEAHKADQDFINRLLKDASPEQRKFLRAGYRQFQRDYEERVGATP